MCRLHVAKLFPVSHSMIWKGVWKDLERSAFIFTFSHYMCLSAVAFAGEHWLWLWPGDHVYIQLLRVPVCCCVCRRTLTATLIWWPCVHSAIIRLCVAVCCCVCRRTLTVTLTWWPCVHSTIMWACLLLHVCAGEHWLWLWPGDHAYIQPLCVPVCCCICRRTLTVTLTWWPCVHSTIMCACLLLHLQENIDCYIDLVTMYTFNHYVCLSAVAFAGEHWLWHWPGDHVYIQPLCVPVCCCVCRRTLTVTLTLWPYVHSTIMCACLLLHVCAGEHWLWLWPGDHVYVQPLCVPVDCCVCRRTLTVTLTWWPCVHSTITCACLLLCLQENIDCDFDLVTSSPAALVSLLDQAPQQGLVSTYWHFHGSDSLSCTLSFFQGALMR